MPNLDPNMRGCFDVRCSVCGARYGWIGKLADRPECPTCKRIHPANTVSMKRLPDHPTRPIPNVVRAPNSRTVEQLNSRPHDIRMPFGKFKGHTLGYIADTAGGLRYLDWLIGQDGFVVERRELAKAIGQILFDNSDRLDQELEGRG